jgi:uncharacterized protein YjiS (DUF1127 family)
MSTGEFFRRWREYRQLTRELKSYSDAELAELGMVRSSRARIAFDAAFGSPLLDYPATEWPEIQNLLDAALDKPARAEPVRAKPTLSALFRRWLTGTSSGGRARRGRNASTI